MIYIKPHEIIKTEQFVREPVDALCKEIMESTSKKIILTGGRGTGKSIVLYNIEDKGLGTENQTICTRFDSIISLRKPEPNEVFDEQFFNHYYELIFSWKLLSYIKSNYILTYESNFKDIEILLEIISDNTDDYCNHVLYEKEELKRYLKPFEISAKILERFKKCLDINTLSLAIDRFDWTNGSSDYVQHILSKYFDLFDKTIITTDDSSLDDKDRKKELESKGYSFVTAQYGQKVNITKQIIRRRMKLYNETRYNETPRNWSGFFDESVMTNRMYKSLVSKSDGNISLMLDTVEEIFQLLDWHEGNIENLEQQFSIATDNQLDHIKQLRKMDAHPPKLHL